MKIKSLPILLVCAFVLAFVTCKKEPDPNIQSFELTKEDLAIGTTSATIEGTYSYAGVIDGIKVCLAENGADKGEFDVELEGNDFSVTLTGLKPATEYQYHYAVDYGFSKPFNTETKTFTTLSSEKPTVKALEVQRIDSTTYRIKCQVVADGGTEVTERGICWNTFGDPVPTEDSLRRYEGAAGLLEEYLVRMEHLASGKKYYVRAYAKNAAGKTGLSEEVLDFETEAPTGTSVEIELSCDPEDGGRVTGGGSYEIGTQCTATAEANAGYTFVNWTENGNQVSSEAAYTFTVTVGRSLVANFTKQAYVIYAEVEPVNSGTVTGATGYDYGEECTLTATPNTGYDFLKWTKGGTTVSTNASFTFTVTETATYKAHFKIKSYTIGVSANPENGGTVEGGGSYDHGQNCTVKATPAEGYAFTNWTDDGEVASEDADYTFTVTSNRTLVANFTELQPDEYFIQVSANPTEGGTVTGGGTYHEGNQCTVKANSNAGFTFINWTENGTQVSVLAEYEFTVEGNRILVANFEAQAPMEYTINVSANPSNGGTVVGGGIYQQGNQCTVEATANEGYTFINWTEDGEVSSTHARYTFNVNSDRTLVANFQVQSYTISVSADPTSGGSVSGGGTYNHGESCTVSATANNGYIFTNWTEDGNVVSSNANYTITVTDDRTLVANFQVQAPNTYNINVSANPPAGGTVDGGGSYQQGQQCTVTANENEGYTFLRWTENGNQVSTNLSYTFTVTGNRTLVAQFQANTYTISVSANPSNGGTVTGGGTYNYDQSCTVTATPSAGYVFANWKENGNVIQGAGASYTFTVTGNRTLEANFTIPTLPLGAIDGLFSVSDSHLVYFSQGNLQYNKTTNEWLFMEHQYDMVETNNQDVGSNYINQNIVSLFGWGTSGNNHGAVCYQPWSTSPINSDYYAYGHSNYNLFDQTGMADWGYNAISNGGNQVGLWRTLTREEWSFVLFSRNTLSGIRYAKAMVIVDSGANVNGLILLPDDWISSYYSLNNFNNGSANYSSNVISSYEWTNNLESHGAIFLPAAGVRNGTLVSDLGNGYYWSASFHNYGPYHIHFLNGNLNPSPYYANPAQGQSVRLVCPAR